MLHELIGNVNKQHSRIRKNHEFSLFPHDTSIMYSMRINPSPPGSGPFIVSSICVAGLFTDLSNIIALFVHTDQKRPYDILELHFL